MSTSGRPLFTGGGGPPECREFIRCVREHAFAEGKSRDEDWTADYAATCITDEAVNWLEDLDPKVRLNWTSLRRALLDKYAPLDDSNSTVPVPAAARRPTLVSVAASPANASDSTFLSRSFSSLSISGRNPVTTQTSRLGRLRIEGPVDGYISKEPGTLAFMKGCYFVTASAADAMQVWCNPSTRSPQHFRFANPPSNGLELGVVWHDAGPGGDGEPTYYSGSLVPLHGKTTLETLGKYWSGVARPALWAFHADLTMKPVWKVAGGVNRVLEACVRRHAEDSKLVLAFVPYPETWVAKYDEHSSWFDKLPAVVKIRFEPV